MSASSRRKGRTYENELASLLPGARRISEAGTSGPDLLWRNRYVEAKYRRDREISIASARKYLDDDTSIVASRTAGGSWILILEIDELLDLIDEAADGRRYEL